MKFFKLLLLQHDRIQRKTKLWMLLRNRSENNITN